jgi:ATP-binding cassette, subfamily B, bacterial PglK
MRSALVYLNQILFILKDDKKKIPWIILLFIFSSLFDLAGLGLIGPYVTMILKPEFLIQSNMGIFLQKIGVSTEPKDIILLLSILLVVVFLIKTIIVLFIKRIIIFFSFDKQKRLQTYLMDAYQHLPYEVYVAKNSSEYIQTINGLVGRFTSGVLKTLLTILSEGIVGIFILIYLAINNFYALILLITLLGSTMFIYDRVFRKNLSAYGQRHDTGSRKVIQAIQEGMDGLKEIRILGKPYFFTNNLKEGAEECRDMEVKSTLIGTMPRYLLEFILVLFLVLLVGGSFILNNDLTVMGPTLAVFVMAALRLAPSATLFSGSLLQFRYGRYATSKLYEDLMVLEKNKKIKNSYTSFKTKSDLESFKRLELKNIYFSYPQADNYVLKNIDLTINAGESIGLIGASGAGKTTILDLLLGLLEPQKGKIIYNDELMINALKYWSKQVAYLPQEIFLTDNSLCENIALAIPYNQIDKNKVLNALRQARLLDMVNELPNGIDTNIGENGIRLSGGQKQRVAIARAFYHEREILVMDEATSSLDEETEKEIVKEIENLKGSKTLIIIAHRFSTVKNCDRIYRLDKGKIIDSGSFEKVIGKS